MILNLMESLDIKGHLIITKVYNSGNKEVIFDDHNIIVSGMGVSLAHLFALSGSDSILDYQIDRFQIGISGSPALEVSSTNQLSGPLSSFAEYGIDGDILQTSAYQVINNSIVSVPRYYGIIPQQNITRIDANTVRYTIVLDENSCNGEDITRGGSQKYLNEVGLFVKNIKNNVTDAPILVAYRHFDDILKTSDFSLVFRWSINF
jgi:hypothetical protein